jgi:hypothetical protein
MLRFHGLYYNVHGNRKPTFFVAIQNMIVETHACFLVAVESRHEQGPWFVAYGLHDDNDKRYAMYFDKIHRAYLFYSK